MTGRQDLVKLKSAITIEKFSPVDQMIDEIIESDPSRPSSMIPVPIVGARYSCKDSADESSKDKKKGKKGK